MMRCRQLVQVCLATVAMAGAAAAAQAQTATADGGKLKVTVEYKGQAGSVDKEHKIWVWLFDNPDISADSTPLAVGALAENKGTYKFVALPKTVYIAAAFDTHGGYDGSSAPPSSGTPIIILGGTALGTPATAVSTGGDDATVTVTFDDTVKMP